VLYRSRPVTGVPVAGIPVVRISRVSCLHACRIPVPVIICYDTHVRRNVVAVGPGRHVDIRFDYAVSVRYTAVARCAIGVCVRFTTAASDEQNGASKNHGESQFYSHEKSSFK
jgi:hypothetical protein